MPCQDPELARLRIDAHVNFFGFRPRADGRAEDQRGSGDCSESHSSPFQEGKFADKTNSAIRDTNSDLKKTQEIVAGLFWGVCCS
jgi:hypothetical protein